MVLQPEDILHFTFILWIRTNVLIIGSEDSFMLRLVDHTFRLSCDQSVVYGWNAKI